MGIAVNSLTAFRSLQKLVMTSAKLTFARDAVFDTMGSIPPLAVLCSKVGSGPKADGSQRAEC